MSNFLYIVTTKGELLTKYLKEKESMNKDEIKDLMKEIDQLTEIYNRQWENRFNRLNWMIIGNLLAITFVIGFLLGVLRTR